MKNKSQESPVCVSGIFLCLLLLVHTLTYAQQLPAIVRDWAAYAGETDSIFKTPVILDEDSNLYVGTFRVDPITGADVLIVKYGTDGGVKWEASWSSVGNGRDQVSDLAYFNGFLYVSGITQTLGNNSFDMLFMRVSDDGIIDWVNSWDGPAGTFDVATAILADNGGVFATGASSDSTTVLNYHTFSFSASDGAIVWQQTYDYAGLNDVPFDLGREGSTLVVTGGSQSSLTNWDYATVFYNDAGIQLGVNRVTGTSSGFDHAQAVKTDALGNVYITGGSYENGVGQEIKTVKIAPSGAVLWVKTYGGIYDDVGNDLTVDANGNVYVCGQANDATTGFDFVLIKYSSGGVQQWKKVIDLEQKDDAAVSLCLDAWGHIVVTGYAVRDLQFDMLTIGFSDIGDELWREFYDGNSHELDKAASIAADAFGSVFVSGQATINGNLQTVTLKYRSDFYTKMPQADSPSVAGLYYPNHGQITDTSWQPNESVDYYTANGCPKLYFGKGKMHMVWSAFDPTGVLPDTLHRIDVTFFGSGNYSKAMPIDELKEAGYLNYFLGHCPNGITNVYGIGSLLFKKVWSGIDVLFSSNNAGVKILFVCEPGSDPSNIGLAFSGQTSLMINGGWDLEVACPIGAYSFDRPHVYQLDSLNAIFNLPWQLNWSLPTADVGSFSNWGAYDLDKSLIIELSKSTTWPSSQIGSLYWSSYFGDFSGESAGVICKGAGEHFYTTSHLNGSSNTIITSGAYQMIFRGGTDLVVTSWSGQPIAGPYGNRYFTTFYGGSGLEISRGVSVNQVNGNIYVTGSTDSPGNGLLPLPTVSAGSNFFYSTLQSTNLCIQKFDAFIARFSEDGSNLLYASYIGGANCDGGLGIEVDNNSENVFLSGYTYSDQITPPFFPIVPSVYSGAYNQSAFAGSLGKSDGYIMEFDKNNNCVWSSYYGGDGDDQINGVKISNSGDIIIAGTTRSTLPHNPGTVGLPCMANSQGEFPDCNPGGGAYFDNSFNSGSSSDYDCIIGEFNNQNNLVWSTYFGGASNDWSSAWQPLSLSKVTSGKFALVGYTNSTQIAPPSFPIINNGSNYFQDYGGTGDGFISVFKNRAPEFSSYIGGGGGDVAIGVAFDEFDFLYITGNTTSTNPAGSCGNPNLGEFPYCSTPTSYNLLHQGMTDAYVFEMDPFYNLSWSTYFGGSDNDQGFGCEVVGRKLVLYGDSRSSLPMSIPQQMVSGYYWQSGQLLGNMDTYLTMFKLSPFVGITEVDTPRGSLLAFPVPFNENLLVEIFA
ncbi:SBBP repeat-containing protein [Candidatus Pollutiaquabacter sp.]|uniref:DUF7948 domain-containing protein n=1 Tax=Candidatus Pollutiaquabacter sp. TaxID=3416354 RepID=UPI003CC00897|nr:SBBP repeat-containing protein [Bacteroidota bacterium]